MANWRVDGEYMETCNCAFLCPCITSNLAARPTEGDSADDERAASIVVGIAVATDPQTAVTQALLLCAVPRSGAVRLYLRRLVSRHEVIHFKASGVLTTELRAS